MKVITKVCPQCGNVFDTRCTRGKFCSLKCGYIFRRDRDKAEICAKRYKTPYLCSVCGNLRSYNTKNGMCQECSLKFRERKTIVKPCSYCGNDFRCYPNAKYCSPKCSQLGCAKVWRDKYPPLNDKEWLEEQYNHLGKTVNKISEELGCNPGLLTKAMREKGIEIRTAGEAAAIFLRQQKGEKHFKWSKSGRKFGKDGYVGARIIVNGLSKWVPEHRLVVEKKLDRELMSKELIHHKNGVKSDNTYQNLAIVVPHNHYGEIRCPFCLETFLTK